MSFIAERAHIESSATVQILDRVKELRRDGVDVISLSAGEPDFVTPEHIRAYAKKALDEGYTFYPEVPGLLDLREAIAEKLKRDNNLDADPKNEIIVTVGGKEAIFLAMMAVVNPGDEVIVTDPCWVSYAPCIRLAGGRPVYLPLSEEDGFHFAPDALEHAVSSKTKIMIVNSPNNPVGNVLSKADLDRVADLARHKHFLVVSDELYEKLIFDGEKHYSIATFHGMKDLTITVNGFSKCLAMTGWRLGYMIAPAAIAARLKAIHSHIVTGPCSFAQRAVALAQQDPMTEKSVKQMAAEYLQRRDLVVRELSKIKGISCVPPRGAFYAFPNISRFGLSSMEFSRTLLEKGRVAVVPGNEFGSRGEGFVRLSFATSREKLTSAFERIKNTLAQLR
jgi:aminotransferase